jgi:hypothetical protein
MTRASAAALGVALAAVVCTPCNAVDLELPDPYEDETPTTLEGEGPAVEHFNRGVEFFKQELYEQALAEFLASHANKANWAVLYNIGVCYHRMGRYVDAIEVLGEYLEKGGGWVPPKRKSFVKKLIEKMEASVGRIVIVHDTPGVRIRIDELMELETPVEEPVTVTTGLHVVRAFFEGYYPFEVEVSVASGTTVEVEIELEPLAVISTWMVLNGSPGQRAPLGRVRLAAWISWGVAGLALSGALVTSAIDLSRAGEQEDLVLATTIQLATAGGTLATGIFLWLAYRAGLNKHLGRMVPMLAVAPMGQRGVGMTLRWGGAASPTVF